MNDESEQTSIMLDELTKPKSPRSTLYPFMLIFWVCAIIIILLFGVNAILTNLKKSDKQVNTPITTTTLTPSTPLPPTQARFEIITGSLYRTLPGEPRKLLVSKDELKVAREQKLEVLEIVSYKVSPDLNHLVVMANVGLTPYALYYRNLTTSETTFIELGQDAAWSADNKYIAIRTGQTDIGPYRIDIYDTQTKKMAETTYSKTLDNKTTTFGKMVWIMERPELIAEYTVFGDYPYNQKEHGTVTITVK